jgi:hypothetical protein
MLELEVGLLLAVGRMKSQGVVPTASDDVEALHAADLSV